MQSKRWLVVAAAISAGWVGAAGAEVQRVEQGNRITENVPDVPAELQERLQRYQNTRSAGFAGWLKDGGVLIGTRFGETVQAHRVDAPMGMREQLTFHREPINSIAAAPTTGANGFVFGKDVGGSEFWQLFYYDLDRREERMLSDGKSRNESPVWSRDGQRIAYSTTRRNGRDTDVHVVDLKGVSRPAVEREGAWYPLDFSPDGQRLLVSQYISINETRPHVVDLNTGAMTALHTGKQPVSYGAMVFSPDGKGIYFTADENSEFQELRFRELSGSKSRSLTSHIPWDVTNIRLAEDGRHLAYVTNEDGISRVHVLQLPDHKEVSLPELPVGVVQGGDFSPDGRSLAVTINAATSPGDVYVIDLATRKLTRWTRSEVGGLDASNFVEPQLIRYPTFDRVNGKPRTIPAFYYRPRNAAPGKPVPVVISIHGGPEAQAFPSFGALTQFLVNELNVAVLVPNVRGSAGYGRSYLLLDNAEKREDSVKDIGALLDWVAQQPELDAKRVGVQGGSYGGYMVLASLVHFGDRLRAGVNIVGISNFISFLNNTESYRRDLRRAEYGDERNPKMRAVLERISPLNNVEKIRSPLFVAQGANDPRVPLSESDQIVSAVRKNGGDVWYLIFKDEGHGFAKKSNADFFNSAAMLFWQQHLLTDQ